MSVNLDKKLKNERNSGLIQKTFPEYRDRLLDYARTYYRNEINDFSESSLGGMFLDFAALIGDSMTFYVDQQINELDFEKSTNIQNINRHLRRAGIKSSPPSPAIVKVDFSIIVPSDPLDPNKPDLKFLPTIKRGTELGSLDDINFILAEDLDFSKKNEGNYQQSPLNLTDQNEAIDYILTKSGICISGFVTEETIFLQGNTTDFISYTLQNSNVTGIERVIDSDLNEYYEVEFLSQDTVFKKIKNSNDTYFEVAPAPYRFIREENFNSNITTLRFGNGDGKTLKDNILINPEDISLPLIGRDYTPRFSLDPNKLLSSLSLGISPVGKSLNIKYSYGGGLSHNVPARSINIIDNPVFVFPNAIDNAESNEIIQLEIISSLSVINPNRAVGGTNGASIDELRLQIPNALKMQSRIITHKDLLARLYVMPSNFGRIHRAAVIENPYTKLTKDLYIVCKDIDSYLVPPQDVLKINIQKYLDEFRLIGDTFNIVDSSIINFGIKLAIKVQEGFEILKVIEEVKIRIIENMRFDSLQIGEAININNIVRVVSNTPGVLSIITPIKDIVYIKSQKHNEIREDGEDFLQYNNNIINVYQNLDNGLLFPTPGGIFELKYSSMDIKIRGT